jgi:hypothetical protein
VWTHLKGSLDLNFVSNECADSNSSTLSLCGFSTKTLCSTALPPDGPRYATQSSNPTSDASVWSNPFISKSIHLSAAVAPTDRMPRTRRPLTRFFPPSVVPADLQPSAAIDGLLRASTVALTIRPKLGIACLVCGLVSVTRGAGAARRLNFRVTSCVGLASWMKLAATSPHPPGGRVHRSGVLIVAVDCQ